jgi:hypothetical protein
MSAEPAPGPASTDWSAHAERLLEQALAEVQDNTDAIPTVDAALHVLRAEAGELPEDETASLAYSLDWESECICPPDLVARGGFRGGCPVHMS